MSATFPAEGAEPVPADPDSTLSESTAPSMDSPTVSDSTTPEEDAEALLANTTWGEDDPENPDFPLSDAVAEPPTSEEAE